jgi:hypothetical protein
MEAPDRSGRARCKPVAGRARAGGRQDHASASSRSSHTADRPPFRWSALVLALGLLAAGAGYGAAASAGTAPKQCRPNPERPADARRLEAARRRMLAAPAFSALPTIDNYAGVSGAKAETLVRAALTGLGFPPDDPSGPGPLDRMFLGRYYLAWIDQTGFYGKMNGLWRLNGAPDESLDFLLKDADGRPVSMLVVGEDGDGRWAAGFAGAEHLEFPSRTPEANDPSACAKGNWCNQYGLNEAAPIGNGKIPWWSACNGSKPGWTAPRSPILALPFDNGLRLIYEGPLVKTADGDGRWDGDACGRDYLFPDGVRHRLWLQVGYELFGDAPYFHRLMRFRNPAGNPPFKGDLSLIGGFVVTAWPEAHYLKRLGNYLRPESRAVEDHTHGLTLLPSQWNGHRFPSLLSDEAFGWLAQPVSLSAGPDYVAGRSATLSHVGNGDNDDTGFCFCSVHGGLELGGGVLHAGFSLPIAGGAATDWAVRRFTLPGSVSSGAVKGLSYEAVPDLRHATGTAETDGWSANPKRHRAGHLAYGPYATNWGSGTVQAVFLLMVNGNPPCDRPLATLDLYDATTAEVLSRRSLKRRDFHAPRTFQRFALDADLAGRAGHTLETRVFWNGAAYLKLGRVFVNVAGQLAER